MTARKISVISAGSALIGILLITLGLIAGIILVLQPQTLDKKAASTIYRENYCGGSHYCTKPPNTSCLEGETPKEKGNVICELAYGKGSKCCLPPPPTEGPRPTRGPGFCTGYCTFPNEQCPLGKRDFLGDRHCRDNWGGRTSWCCKGTR